MMRLLLDDSAGGLVIIKAYPSALISVFLTGFRYFSYQAATTIVLTRLGGAPFQILCVHKNLYVIAGNRTLEQQSDMLTTIP